MVYNKIKYSFKCCNIIIYEISSFKGKEKFLQKPFLCLHFATYNVLKLAYGFLSQLLGFNLEYLKTV